jgi:hypothetical protein
MNQNWDLAHETLGEAHSSSEVCQSHLAESLMSLSTTFRPKSHTGQPS